MRSRHALNRTARFATSVLLCFFAGLANAGGGLNAHDLELYRALLEEHTEPTSDVVQTRVHYTALEKDRRWKQLVKGLAAADPRQLGSREERLAFWINAYNILAIDLVLSGYPLGSIKDLGSFFSPVWEVAAGKIGGRDYTLEEIEHEILRPMGEPRIHSAIVCASVSCPPLARTPFEVATIDAQLDSIVRAWLANPKKGLRLDRADETLHLSKIFDWFEEDFEATGGVIHFALPHMAPDDAAWLRTHRADVDIEYFDYDWGLND